MLSANSLLVYAIGFTAQIFFSSRILLQWIKSEKAGRVLSPTLFWVLSIAGSYLLFIYGWFRNDFSILLGQYISYYIYLWNLNEKGVWVRVPRTIQLLLIATPIIATIGILQDTQHFVENFLHPDKVATWLIIFGSAGQIVFTLRFVYQWFYSRNRHDSILPQGFWIMSLTGSGIIVAYGIIRLDPVLILGQSVGFIAYTRNIMIGRKS